MTIFGAKAAKTAKTAKDFGGPWIGPSQQLSTLHSGVRGSPTRSFDALTKKTLAVLAVLAALALKIVNAALSHRQAAHWMVGHRPPRDYSVASAMATWGSPTRAGAGSEAGAP